MVREGMRKEAIFTLELFPCCSNFSNENDNSSCFHRGVVKTFRSVTAETAARLENLRINWKLSFSLIVLFVPLIFQFSSCSAQKSIKL
jgi:hypothetical protein